MGVGDELEHNQSGGWEKKKIIERHKGVGAELENKQSRGWKKKK